MEIFNDLVELVGDDCVEGVRDIKIVGFLDPSWARIGMVGECLVMCEVLRAECDRIKWVDLSWEGEVGVNLFSLECLIPLWRESFC